MKKVGLITILGLAFLVGALMVNGCGPSAPKFTPAPTPAPAPKLTPAPTPAPAPPAKKIDLKLTDWQTPGHFFEAATEQMVKRVGERTKGMLTISQVKATALGLAWKDILPSLKQGSIQMSSSGSFYLSGQSPLFTLAWLPLFIENTREMSVADHALRDVLQREFNNFGVQLLGLFPYDEQVLTSTVPVNKIGDFKALRVRPTGTEMAELLQAVGATPVTMPMGEVYTSAQRGLLNAYIGGWDGHRRFSDWEVFKYVLDFSWNAGCQVLLISKDIYDTLPADYKVILLEEVQKCVDDQYSAAITATLKGRQALQEHKMTFITPSEELKAQLRAQGKVVVDNWSKKSPAAAEALKIINFVLGK